MENNFHFHLVDYVIFASMLTISACTGLYYGCRSRYCKSVGAPNLREYLTGSQSMKPFPVAMSLVGSYISGVTMLGTPTEIYNFGTQYWFIAISVFISGCIVAFVYLPVFWKLQVNSSYEYLEMRFNREVRSVASVLFVIDEVMFLPIVIYVPSLAFNQVTGIDVHLIGSIVCFVCVFYTVLGGIRAVVYTDAWQIVVMFMSVIVIVVLGTIAVGGPSTVWNRSYEGNRIIFDNFNFSFYDRHTVFSVLIGGTFYWTAFNSVNQTMVQRYLSLHTERDSKISIFLFLFGVVSFISLCAFSGLLVFATYYKCDPLISGRISQDDQMLPLFVMETAGHLRGVPGLFIAGVFGAALSSLSVILNSTSAVVLEDFVKGCMRINLSEQAATLLVKIVVLSLGAMSMGFLFVIEHMGGVLAAATSLSAIAASSTFGVFTLGMIIPWANSLGAIVGAIAGAIMSSLVAFGTQYAAATGQVVVKKLPINSSECFDKYGIYANVSDAIYPDESHIFPLFRFSYHWITPLGILTTIIVGTIVSFAVGKTNLKTLDPEVISPVAQWLLPEESQRYIGSASKKVRERTNYDENRGLMQEITVSSINLRHINNNHATTALR